MQYMQLFDGVISKLTQYMKVRLKIYPAGII